MMLSKSSGFWNVLVYSIREPFQKLMCLQILLFKANRTSGLSQSTVYIELSSCKIENVKYHRRTSKSTNRQTECQ